MADAKAAEVKTSVEFKEARHKLGLSVYELGSIINIDARTVRRWEDGERPPNPVACRVMRWMLDGYRPPEWPTTSGQTSASD